MQESACSSSHSACVSLSAPVGPRLPECEIGNHFDEEVGPFRRLVDVGALDGEQFVGGLASHDAIGEHLAAQPGYVHGGDLTPDDHRADDGAAAVDGD